MDNESTQESKLLKRTVGVERSPGSYQPTAYCNKVRRVHPYGGDQISNFGIYSQKRDLGFLVKGRRKEERRETKFPVYAHFRKVQARPLILTAHSLPS